MLNSLKGSKYRVIKQLGKGAFGAAYEVSNINDHKKYALKEIQMKEASKEEVDQLKKESRILSTINNDNVVKYFESFTEKDTFNIVMEFCEGSDLNNYIKENKQNNKKIEEKQIYKFIYDICKGLLDIHNNKLIHRDLKPANIFLTKDLNIKIGDFGIAKQLSSYHEYALTCCGTMLYMAPELINAEKYNYKADCWSLGCIIYELCTFNYCFYAKSPLVLFKNITESNYKKIEDNYYGDELKDIINSLLNKDYKSRASIEDILNKAKSYLEKNSINIDSNIIGNNKDYKQYLIQWLEKPNQDKKNIKDIKLLYRGSKDNFKSNTFHEKCDKKGETLVIIKSDKDYIFGGYTEINWDSTTWNGKVGEQNNSRRNGKGNEFIFTLKNPHNISPSKFNMKQEWINHSICCDKNIGPIFGCNDIRIENDCNVKNNSFSYYDFKPGEYCFNDTTGKKRLLFTGEKTYKVKEIEVYNVIR